MSLRFGLRLLACFLFYFGLGGCASDQEQDAELNSLWRSGYGFNNPNVERIQHGETPRNFDGSK